MIPPTARRVTSSSLVAIRNAGGRQVARQATWGKRTNNITVAQFSEGIHQQTRGFFQTSPSRSALNSALQPKEKDDTVRGESKSEDSLGRPEHAVISTFDLFSIGGSDSYLPQYLSRFKVTASRHFSWSQQLTHCRPHAGRQYIYQRPERAGSFGTSAYGIGACDNTSADNL